MEAGRHGSPVSSTVKRSRGRACVCPPRTARRRHHTGGEKVEGATPRLLALVRHRAGEMVHAKFHHLPLPVGGRSLHRDPWWEGVRTDEEAGVPHRPQAGAAHERRRLRQRQSERRAGRSVCRHATLHWRSPFRPAHTAGLLWLSVDKPHSLSLTPRVRSAQRGTLLYRSHAGIRFSIELYCRISAGFAASYCPFFSRACGKPVPARV